MGSHQAQHGFGGPPLAGRAQQNQLVARVENSVAARIDLHTPGGANGQHQDPATGPQLNLRQAATGQPSEVFLARGELNALNLILGARKHLHEAHRFRMQGLRGQGAAAGNRWGDHVVGARTAQLAGGLPALGPGNHLNPRRQSFGAQHHVDILRIRAQHRHKTTGPLHPGLAEHVVKTGVTGDAIEAVFHGHGRALGLLIDHQQRHVFPGHASCHLLAHAAVAANDHVVTDCIKHGLLTAKAEAMEVTGAAELDKALDHQLNGKDAPQQEENGDQAPPTAQGMDLPVTHRGEGDNGHPEGIGPTVAGLRQPIGSGAGNHQNHQGAEGDLPHLRLPQAPFSEETFARWRVSPTAVEHRRMEKAEKPLTRVELVTSPLPRECSTAELQGQMGRVGFEPT